MATGRVVSLSRKGERRGKNRATPRVIDWRQRRPWSLSPLLGGPF